MDKLTHLNKLSASTRRSKKKLYNLIYEYYKDSETPLPAFRELGLKKRISNKAIYDMLRSKLNVKLPKWSDIPLSHRSNFKHIYNLLCENSEPAELSEINVSVRDEKNNPVPDLKIFFKGNNKKYECITDENGIYHIGNVKQGTYKVYVDEKEDRYDIDSLKPIICEVDNTPAEYKATISKIQTYSVNGYVLDKETSLPIINSKVYLYKDGEKVATSKVKDDDGSFSFSNCKNGIYRLKLMESDYNPYDVEIEVKNEDIRGYRIFLIPTTTELYTIGGTVKDKETTAVLKDVKVTLTEMNGSTIDSTVTDENGFYIFVKKVSKGNYKLIASLKNYDDNELSVENIDKDCTDYNFNLTRITQFSNISVKLVDADTKKGISDVTISIDGKTGTTGSAGGCTIKEVPYGTYDVKVFNVPEDYDLSSLFPTRVTVNDEEVLLDLSLSKNVEPFSDVTFKLTADNESKEKIVGADIILTDLSDESKTYTGTTDKTAFCEILNVPFGEYKVSVENIDDKYDKDSLNIPNITLNTSSDYYHLTINEKVESTILTVQDSSGKGIPNASIEFEDSTVLEGDENGKIIISKPIGQYKVLISVDDDSKYNPYVWKYETLTIIPNVPLSITLSKVYDLETGNYVSIYANDAGEDYLINDVELTFESLETGQIFYDYTKESLNLVHLPIGHYKLKYTKELYYDGENYVECVEGIYNPYKFPIWGNETMSFKCRCVKTDGTGVEGAKLSINGGDSDTTDKDGYVMATTKYKIGTLLDIKITHEDYQDITAKVLNDEMNHHMKFQMIPKE